jgi:hypothetical protein
MARLPAYDPPAVNNNLSWLGAYQASELVDHQRHTLLTTD